MLSLCRLNVLCVIQGILLIKILWFDLVNYDFQRLSSLSLTEDISHVKMRKMQCGISMEPD